MSKVNLVLVSVIGGVALLAFVYFSTMMGKKVTYSMFYEDMVKQTISEMVKEGSLR